MASKSPTARTLEHCRKLGWRACKVEQTVPKTFVKRDAFGFGDVLAIDMSQEPYRPILIQATSESGGNVSKRTRKIIEECTLDATCWLLAGGLIQVWGWGKKVHRNKDGAKSRVKRWTLRRVAVLIDEIDRDGEGVYLGSEVIE